MVNRMLSGTRRRSTRRAARAQKPRTAVSKEHRPSRFHSQDAVKSRPINAEHRGQSCCPSPMSPTRARGVFGTFASMPASPAGAVYRTKPPQCPALARGIFGTKLPAPFPGSRPALWSAATEMAPSSPTWRCRTRPAARWLWTSLAERRPDGRRRHRTNMRRVRPDWHHLSTGALRQNTILDRPRRFPLAREKAKAFSAAARWP